jgi:FixJ family two-component response regulator
LLSPLHVRRGVDLDQGRKRQGLTFSNGAAMWKLADQMTKPLICIVDDDPAVRNSLQFALELEGFGVSVYPDADTFLASSGLDQTSCLVIDYKMPRTNGLELLAKLRARNIRTPAILMVSHSTPAVHLGAKKAGVPIVEKPLLGNALTDHIHAALGQHHKMSRAGGQLVRSPD